MNKIGQLLSVAVLTAGACTGLYCSMQRHPSQNTTADFHIAGFPVEVRYIDTEKEIVGHAAARQKPVPEGYVPWDKPAFSADVRALVQAEASRLGLSQAEADRLADTAAEMFAIQFNPQQVRRYVALLAERDVTPKPPIYNAVTFEEEGKPRSPSSVANAPLKPETLQIAWAFRDGKRFAPTYDADYDVANALPGMRGGNDVPFRLDAGHDIIRIAVDTLAVESETFRIIPGRFAVYFTLRQPDGAWIPMRLEFVDDEIVRNPKREPRPRVFLFPI